MISCKSDALLTLFSIALFTAKLIASLSPSFNYIDHCQLESLIFKVNERSNDGLDLAQIMHELSEFPML